MCKSYNAQHFKTRLTSGYLSVCLAITPVLKNHVRFIPFVSVLHFQINHKAVKKKEFGFILMRFNVETVIIQGVCKGLHKFITKLALVHKIHS